MNDGNVKHTLLESYLQAPVWCLDPDPEEINILQDLTVQRRVLILLGLVYVSLAVSSAVFLSMSTPLVTVGFAPNKQLLGSDFSFPHNNGEGGRGENEKQREKSGTERVVI